MIDKHKKCAPCQIKQDDDNEMIYHIIHFQFRPFYYIIFDRPRKLELSTKLLWGCLVG